jgi:hypothetical protein
MTFTTAAPALADDNSASTIGDLNCSDGLVQAKVLVNAIGQHVIVSNLTIDKRTIALSTVTQAVLDDSTLLIRAPGFALKAKIPSRHGVGIRQGTISINGKHFSTSCMVPEISDL